MRSPLPAFVSALAVALLAGAPAPARAAEALLLGRADAPIKSVTVYASQALVKREAAFDAAQPGPLAVTLARLPPRIRDDSVRVRAGKGLTLLGSRVVSKPVAQSSLPALEELRTAHRTVLKERQAVADAQTVANLTIEHVKAIQGAHAVESSAFTKPGAAAELAPLVEWCAKTIAGALEARRAADEKLADIDRQKALLEQKIRELEQTSGYEKDLEIELEAGAAGKYRVEVEYVTDGASWAPFYDFRADQDAKAIDVTYLGVVKQSTGEDWTGVQLALSTARPELGARPPDLAQWSVGMRPPARAYTGSASRRAEEAPAAPAPSTSGLGVAGGGTAFEEGETRVAAVESRGATVAFTIPTPETVPSDGKDKRTTIGRKSVPAENRYFSVPKLSPFAYLRSTVKNEFPYPMLAGAANVFFGPDFVGRSRVDLVPPGEKLEVFLGVDERLKIERKIEKRFRDTKGIISTDVRERYEFKIIAKNHRDVPIQLTILDQLPVSTNEDVRIEDVSFSIEPTEKKKTGGEVRWDVGLASKAETQIAIGFTIRFPEKREGEVAGLER